MRVSVAAALRASLLASLLAGSGCENDLVLDEPERYAPAQASVVTSNGVITVHWSAVDDAIAYNVLLSIVSDDAGSPVFCDGSFEMTATSPCRIVGNTPGQLYYVRVKSFAADGETDDDPPDEDLPALTVRAGFPGIPETPFTWPGVAVFTEDRGDDVQLEGMWFEDDAASAEHACYTYWDDGTERELDPCSNEDLRFGADDSSAVRFGSCGVRACYTIFQVEADDGRTGQSYTRMIHP